MRCYLKSDGAGFLEDFFNVGAGSLLQYFVQRDMLEEGELEVGYLLAVTELYRCIQKVAVEGLFVLAKV